MWLLRIFTSPHYLLLYPPFRALQDTVWITGEDGEAFMVKFGTIRDLIAFWVLPLHSVFVSSVLPVDTYYSLIKVTKPLCLCLWESSMRCNAMQPQMLKTTLKYSNILCSKILSQVLLPPSRKKFTDRTQHRTQVTTLIKRSANLSNSRATSVFFFFLLSL